MGEQLQHHSINGGSCSRCGLRYSVKTSYVACFEEGDTFETWFERQCEEVKEMIRPGSAAKDKDAAKKKADSRWPWVERPAFRVPDETGCGFCGVHPRGACPAKCACHNYEGEAS